MSKARYTVYGIRVKESQQIIYVGSTILPLKERFFLHTTGTNKINTLYKREELEILSLQVHLKITPPSENRWIDKLKKQGHPLLNKRKSNYSIVRHTRFHAINNSGILKRKTA